MKWFTRLKRFAFSFQDALTFYRNPLSFAVGLGLTVVAWSLEVAGQMFLLQGFGLQIGFFEVFALATVSWIVGTFSFLPGGLGAREAAFAFLASLLNYPFAIVFTMALLYRFFVYASFLVTGIVAASLEKKDALSTLLNSFTQSKA